MKLRIGLAVVAVASIGFAACGSSGGSNPRAAIVDKAVADAKKEGVTLDRACALKAANALSDDDVKKIASDTSDTLDITALSDEGQQAAVKMFDCQPLSADGLTGTQQVIFDELKTSLGQSGTVDEDCLRSLVKNLDSSILITQDSDAITELGQNAAKCVS